MKHPDPFIIYNKPPSSLLFLAIDFRAYLSSQLLKKFHLSDQLKFICYQSVQRFVISSKISSAHQLCFKIFLLKLLRNICNIFQNFVDVIRYTVHLNNLKQVLQVESASSILMFKASRQSSELT
jgi:hypothetical protein